MLMQGGAGHEVTLRCSAIADTGSLCTLSWRTILNHVVRFYTYNYSNGLDVFMYTDPSAQRKKAKSDLNMYTLVALCPQECLSPGQVRLAQSTPVRCGERSVSAPCAGTVRYHTWNYCGFFFSCCFRGFCHHDSKSTRHRGQILKSC